MTALKLEEVEARPERGRMRWSKFSKVLYIVADRKYTRSLTFENLEGRIG